jgi:hypothetical protein
MVPLRMRSHLSSTHTNEDPMSDMLQAANRIEVNTQWVATYVDLGATIQKAERLRAIETVRMFHTAKRWLGSKFSRTAQSPSATDIPQAATQADTQDELAKAA